LTDCLILVLILLLPELPMSPAETYSLDTTSWSANRDTVISSPTNWNTLL